MEIVNSKVYIKIYMLKVYNSLTRKKEVFKPIKPPKVNMYVCGPTVYGPSHLGHARTYIAFDIIRRYIQFKGYKVKYIVNITDIHDDIIKKSKKLKINIKDLAKKHTNQFFQDITNLGIKKADYYPRVTDHIKEIIEMIKILEKKGFAYQLNKSVYFNISKFKDYGKLSRIKIRKNLSGTRIKTDKYEKEAASDFVLWKAAKVGEPNWSSPWGKGRPGWHIECSVMSKKYLGEQFDIHGGAIDLIFPHHENEIAQSEGASGSQPFVKYWLHSGLLKIDGQKMSKSLGNYIEIPQALQEYPPRLIRYLIINSHYRSSFDFNKKTIEQVKKSIQRIDEFINKLQSPSIKKVVINKNKEKKLILTVNQEFEYYMDDDFNTPRALSSIFKLIKYGNLLLEQNKLTPKNAKDILNFFKKIDKVFNFIFLEDLEKKELPKNVLKLAVEREIYRKKKDWQMADTIREKIRKMGYKIKDTKNGPIVIKIF